MAAAEPVAVPEDEELSDPDREAEEEEAVPVNTVTSLVDVAVALVDAGELDPADPVEAEPEPEPEPPNPHTLANHLPPSTPKDENSPAPSLSTPAVTVTPKTATSVPSYVVVELPGKFAPLPPALSVQTAPVVPCVEHICVPVNAVPSPMNML